MKFIVGITIFVLGVLHSGSAHPTVSHIKADKPINDLGSTVRLQCQVVGLQDYAITWSKIDKTSGRIRLIAENSTSSPATDDDKISAKLNRDDGTYALRIRDFQVEDEGLYQCQVVVSADERVTAEIEVKARKPPVFTKNSTTSLVIREGYPMKLECYADGFPEPQITFRRENNYDLPTATGGSAYRGNVLSVDAVSRQHGGWYYCVADNAGVGRSVRHIIQVDIEFASTITVPRPRVGQALQFDADLTCRVEAYPPAAVFWYKDGVQISCDNEHYVFSNFATDGSVVESTIKIKKIVKEDYGHYVCKAANKVNSVEAGIELFETKKPICPPACNVQEIQQNNTGQDDSAANVSSSTESQVP